MSAAPPPPFPSLDDWAALKALAAALWARVGPAPRPQCFAAEIASLVAAAMTMLLALALALVARRPRVHGGRANATPPARQPTPPNPLWRTPPILPPQARKERKGSALAPSRRRWPPRHPGAKLLAVLALCAAPGPAARRLARRLRRAAASVDDAALGPRPPRPARRRAVPRRAARLARFLARADALLDSS